MATLEKASSEVDNCRFLLQGMAKNLADRLYGPQGPPAGTRLTHLETIADLLTQSIRQSFLDLLLARQSAAFHQALPADLRLCPSCQHETLPAEAEPAGLVELCSVTSLTPSIRRRRLSVWATSDWLVAQPLRTKTGTLPGGVTDVTAPALPVAPDEGPVFVAAPTVPLNVEIDARRGSTLPSSWKA